jgi:HPt (histidine-containing phosphotransfer) domain-containing protein
MKTAKSASLEGASVTFSLEQLNKIGNNDIEFTNRMVGKFIIMVSEFTANLRSVLKTNDWVKLKTIAHKNIPAYSFMGLDDLVEYIKYLESNALDMQEQAHLKEMSEVICRKNDQIISSMREYLIQGAEIKTGAGVYDT